jgi:hypothetical protein
MPNWQQVKKQKNTQKQIRIFLPIYLLPILAIAIALNILILRYLMISFSSHGPFKFFFKVV